ncbi:magnesium transporter NIPA-domain-containing protein [Mycena leptocephala]|nr:magnesium transporter NIPA-domain-containing protein [Mycena leptocephala]
MPETHACLAMAMVGSFAIGTSSVITKMLPTSRYLGPNRLRRWNGVDGKHGFSAEFDVWSWAKEVANFDAYTFAPPTMVTPLGALSVIVAAVFASFLLNERLGHLGCAGCTLCILGSSIIILHTPEDQELETVTHFLEYAAFTVLIVSLIMASGVAPQHGRTKPLVSISIASLVGDVSVMFVKGFSVALKFTFSGENQFVYPSTYLFIFIAGVCIVVQLNYANKVLDLFSVNLCVLSSPSPRYSIPFDVPFDDKLTDVLACAWGESNLLRIEHHKRIQYRLPLSGFVVTFLGVHILNIAMLDESEAASRAASNVSLGGKWGPKWAADAALWGVCNRGGAGEETVRLERPEEEGEEYGEDVDETTALHVGGLASSSSSRGGSRRASPLPRISPRPV